MDSYEIRVVGHLADRRAATFPGAKLRRHPDGSTSVVVRVPDQAALHGLLEHVRDLGLELLEVRRGSAPDGPAAHQSSMAARRAR